MAKKKAEPRRGRLNKSLRELAEKSGYTPGEFSLVRFAQDAKTVKAWLDDIERGVLPEGLSHMRLGDASRLARKEADALIERERAWMPFFYPTMKSTEITGEGGGPVEVKGIAVSFVAADDDG